MMILDLIYGASNMGIILSNQNRKFVYTSLVLIIFIALILSSFAAGQELLTGNQFEKSLMDIIPPPLPVEDIGGVDNKFQVDFTLHSYSDQKSITDIHVFTEISNIGTKEAIKTLNYVGNNGVLSLALKEGDYKIVLKIDDINSLGKDFFYSVEKHISKNSDETIFLFPVGSVRGTIYDSKNNLIRNAEVKAICSSNYDVDYQVSSDEFGSYTFEYLPIGQCKILAKFNSNIGSKNVEILQGNLQELDIKFTNRLSQSFSSIFILLILFLILSAIFFAYSIKNKKGKSKKNDGVIKPEIIKNNRTNDILKTLNEKERKVVELLLQNNNSSTQAKIRYGTLIPKTSLIRVFHSLESKKIIIVESVGKLKKIKLTEWFLGGN